MSTPNTARFRIGAIAQATGISPETLRIWERRYAALTPVRAAGGGRFYTEADLRRLRLIKQLLDRGHGIGRIARLDEEALRELLAAHRGAEPGPEMARVREQFLAAVARLDLAEAHGVLARAALLLDPRSLALEVAVPLLRDVGARWEAGQAQVCHEHAASGVIRSVLGGLLASHGRGQGVATVITGTPSGELHEFGALVAALLATAAGWRAVYLGPNLPATEIVDASAQAQAQAVVLSVVNPPSPETARALAAVARTLPARTRLIVGGHHARQVTALAPRAELLDDLALLDERLAAVRP